MSSDPFLSIIVPVYNVKNYLSVCIDSILAQTCTDYELILVDDGSTDGSSRLCDDYAAANPRIRCLHQPNSGHTAARQKGYQASRGEYVTFVDSDDWIRADMYDRMCRAAKDTRADILHCNYIAAAPDREITCSSPFPAGFYDKSRLEKEVYPRMIYFGDFFTYGIAPSLCNKIFRRSLLEKHLFHVPQDIIVGEDGLASYSCMLDAESIYFFEEAFYYYRSNADSVSHHSMPHSRLLENRRMFDTYSQVIDFSRYPYMEKQLDYYFVYQCLLTFIPVFGDMLSSARDFRQRFMEECNYPPIRKAFHTVAASSINGLHNKLYTFCIRHRLYRLFRLLLQH